MSIELLQPTDRRGQNCPETHKLTPRETRKRWGLVALMAGPVIAAVVLASCARAGSEPAHTPTLAPTATSVLENCNGPKVFIANDEVKDVTGDGFFSLADVLAQRDKYWPPATDLSPTPDYNVDGNDEQILESVDIEDPINIIRFDLDGKGDGVTDDDKLLLDKNKGTYSDDVEANWCLEDVDPKDPNHVWLTFDKSESDKRIEEFLIEESYEKDAINIIPGGEVVRDVYVDVTQKLNGSNLPTIVQSFKDKKEVKDARYLPVFTSNN